jgi:thiamine-phosphate pyrophosphorylase
MQTIPEGIYPVITEKFCSNGSSLLTLKQVLQGGARIVQLREKELSKKELLVLARKYRVLTKKAGALLIINDHLDLALAVDADGVHLGQDDLPCQEAKRLAPGLIIGVSTHNMQEALKAVQDGADYINLGPVFATKTREHCCKPLGVEVIRKIAARLDIPFTVMGGIKPANLSQLLAAGCRRIAVVTAITGSAEPAHVTRELNRLILTTATTHSSWPPRQKH